MTKFIQLVPEKTGVYTIMTKFGKDVDWIINDPSDPSGITDANFPLIVWPYGTSKVKLRWKEEVADVESAATEMITINGVERKKYINLRQFLKSKLVIGTREEWVDIMKNESHLDVAEVISEDAASLELVLQISVEIGNPIKAKGLEDPLGQIHNQVISVVREWASKKKFKEIRQVAGTDILSEIDKDITKLNNSDFFTSNQFKILGFPAIPYIFVAEESQDFLNAEENIGIEENNTKAQERILKQEELKAKGQDAMNEVNMKFIEKKYKAHADFINKTSENLAKVAEASNKGLPQGLKYFNQGGGTLSTLESILLGKDDEETGTKKRGGNNGQQ